MLEGQIFVSNDDFKEVYRIIVNIYVDIFE